jgi:hypothetical protein
MKTPNALPVDLLSGGFIIINILAILFAWDRALNPLGLIRGYGLLLVMIPLLIFADSRIPKANPDHARAARWARTVFDMIRLGYPLMTMLFFYLTVYRFHHLVFPEMLDPYFAAADQHIFGYQPALVWQQRWDNFWISELLHAAYFGYFVILGLLPMAMFFRRREDLNEMVFASVTVYYLAGLTYILLPVAGGRFDPEQIQQHWWKAFLTRCREAGNWSDPLNFLCQWTGFGQLPVTIRRIYRESWPTVGTPYLCFALTVKKRPFSLE